MYDDEVTQLLTTNSDQKFEYVGTELNTQPWRKQLQIAY